MSQKRIRAAGALVYTRDDDGDLLVLLIKDRYGAWTLPKGHVEPDEAEEAAAVREIAEETGIACAIEGPLAHVCYPVLKHGEWRDKEVTYFLARADHATPEPATAEGISEARWAAPAEALATIHYSQIRDVTRQALAALDEPV